jgi:hypothetical protein
MEKMVPLSLEKTNRWLYSRQTVNGKKSSRHWKNQDKVEVTKMPNAVLNFFLTCQLLDLNLALIYSIGKDKMH